MDAPVVFLDAQAVDAVSDLLGDVQVEQVGVGVPQLSHLVGEIMRSRNISMITSKGYENLFVSLLIVMLSVLRSPPLKRKRRRLCEGPSKHFITCCNLLIDTQLEVLVVQGNLFRRDFVGGVKTSNT